MLGGGRAAMGARSGRAPARLVWVRAHRRPQRRQRPTRWCPRGAGPRSKHNHCRRTRSHQCQPPLRARKGDRRGSVSQSRRRSRVGLGGFGRHCALTCAFLLAVQVAGLRPAVTRNRTSSRLGQTERVHQHQAEDTCIGPSSTGTRRPHWARHEVEARRPRITGGSG